jgi:hypothetical protein
MKQFDDEYEAEQRTVAAATPEQATLPPAAAPVRSWREAVENTARPVAGE